MKLTTFNGIINNLLDSLYFNILFNSGFIKCDMDNDSNILEPENDFDKHCYDFFIRSIPKSFDMGRIKKIIVKTELKKITKNGVPTGSSVFSLRISVFVDDKVFSKSIKGHGS